MLSPSLLLSFSFYFQHNWRVWHSIISSLPINCAPNSLSSRNRAGATTAHPLLHTTRIMASTLVHSQRTSPWRRETGSRTHTNRGSVERSVKMKLIAKSVASHYHRGLMTGGLSLFSGFSTPAHAHSCVSGREGCVILTRPLLILFLPKRRRRLISCWK